MATLAKGTQVRHPPGACLSLMPTDAQLLGTAALLVELKISGFADFQP